MLAYKADFLSGFIGREPDNEEIGTISESGFAIGRKSPTAQ